MEKAPKNVVRPDFSEEEKKRRGIFPAENVKPEETQVIDTNEEGEKVLDARRFDRGVLRARGIGLQGQKIEEVKTEEALKEFLITEDDSFVWNENQRTAGEQARSTTSNRSEVLPVKDNDERGALLEFPKKFEGKPVGKTPKKSGFLGGLKELFSSWGGGGASESGEKYPDVVRRLNDFRKKEDT
jgi:hypothetical protein